MSDENRVIKDTLAKEHLGMLPEKKCAWCGSFEVGHKPDECYLFIRGEKPKP